MTDIVASDAVMALIQVVMINLVLSGDNAIVIGLAAAGLPADQRKRAILIGILAATALRIAFASIATQLLQVFGLSLAGGILLLWVCWKMWRELRTTPQDQQGGDETLLAYAPGRSGTVAGSFGHKTIRPCHIADRGGRRLDVFGQRVGRRFWRHANIPSSLLSVCSYPLR